MEGKQRIRLIELEHQTASRVTWADVWSGGYGRQMRIFFGNTNLKST